MFMIQNCRMLQGFTIAHGFYSILCGPRTYSACGDGGLCLRNSNGKTKNKRKALWYCWFVCLLFLRVFYCCDMHAILSMAWIRLNAITIYTIAGIYFWCTSTWTNAWFGINTETIFFLFTSEKRIISNNDGNWLPIRQKHLDYSTTAATNIIERRKKNEDDQTKQQQQRGNTMYVTQTLGVSSPHIIHIIKHHFGITIAYDDDNDYTQTRRTHTNTHGISRTTYIMLAMHFGLVSPLYYIQLCTV